MLSSLPIVLCACFIPAEVEQPDASRANSPPVIIASDPSMPGFDMIDTSKPRSITVKDNDVADTTYVRVFRDYNAASPTAPLNDQKFTNDPILGMPVRVLQLPTNTWCNGATSGIMHAFDVVVADREFNPNPAVKPEYQALPDGAEFSIRTWVATCP